MLKRCSEILACLIKDKQTSALLDEIVLKGKEVSLELRIKKENGLKIQELRKMKPKFHLGELLCLRDKNIFSGKALDTVQSTIQRLKSKHADVAVHDEEDNDNDDDEDDNAAGDNDEDAGENDDIDNDAGDNDEDDNNAGDNNADDDDEDVNNNFDNDEDDDKVYGSDNDRSDNVANNDT